MRLTALRVFDENIQFLLYIFLKAYCNSTLIFAFRQKFSYYLKIWTEYSK